MALPASLSDTSRDYHRKGQLNLRVSDAGKASLTRLAEFYGIGVSSVVEMMARERVHELNLSIEHAAKPRSPKKRK